MMARDLGTFFLDVFPLQRKRGAWVLPSVLGLGLGLAAGIGVGILIAPEPGDATRRKLARGAEDLQRKASRFVDRTRGELEATGHEIAGEARAEMSRVRG
jgi:gas vesicle protein